MAKAKSTLSMSVSRAPAIWAICALITSTITATALAQNKHHPHSDIKESVKSFVSEQITSENITEFEVKVGKLDQRLKLNYCDEPLSPFFSPGSQLNGSTTVGVRCTGAKPWTVYIPTDITIYRNVLVTSHPLLKGQVISRQDLKQVRKTISARDSHYISDPAHVIGMIAKRSIPEGKTLSPHLLYAPRLVNRGQAVILLAKTKSLEVRMTGQALADGAKGDVIQVRNAKSKRIVEGIVTKHGVVEVNM